MRRLMLPIAALLLAAPPLARACDQDAMNAELTAVCRAALDPAAQLVRTIRAEAAEAERQQIDAALATAEEACDTGDPTIGAREAVRLARLVGRIEARRPTPPPA